MADAAFHGRIIALSGNRTLMRVWHTLEPFSRTYITIEAPGADRRRIADQHVPVLEALRERDPVLATAVLHRHFEEAAAGLARHWSDIANNPQSTPSPLGGGGAPRPVPGPVRGSS